MTVSIATNQSAWDSYLCDQPYSPFLQSWTMGEVYRAVNEEPIRLQVTHDNGNIVGICQAITVPARRGKHLACLYGPVASNRAVYELLINELKRIGQQQGCWFVRLSPFVPTSNDTDFKASCGTSYSAPLHVLGEHVWYIPLTQQSVWTDVNDSLPRDSEEIFMQLRKTTRNLVRRARKEGVTVEKSTDPMRDLETFIELHEETRKRHSFVPYSNNFFRAQVEQFSARDECTLYLARYQGEVLAASVHMHMGGETSYHHGASTHTHPKIPASYLLQWTAIEDALERGDKIYSFWGIAPEGAKKHPFKGVTTFKTGFGGELLQLTHCRDIPLKPQYHITRLFELGRKWKRGF